MPYSFPGEDSIRARAIDAHNGSEAPEEHYNDCPCHGQSEDERDLELCICEELAIREEEDARADAILDSRDW